MKIVHKKLLIRYITILSILSSLLATGCFSGKPLRQSIPNNLRNEFRVSVNNLIQKSQWKDACALMSQYEYMHEDSYANYISAECLLRGITSSTNEHIMNIEGVNLLDFHTREERNGIILLVRAASCGEKDAISALKVRNIDIEIPSKSDCNTYQPEATQLTKNARGVTAMISPALIVPLLPAAAIKKALDNNQDQAPPQKLEEASPSGPKTIIEFPAKSLFKSIGNRNIEYETSSFNAVPGLTKLSFAIPRPLDLQWMKETPDLAESKTSRVSNKLPVCRFEFKLPVNGHLILSYKLTGKDSQKRETFRCEIIDKISRKNLMHSDAKYE